MKKEALLARVNSEWDSFLGSFSDLPDERLTVPGVVGDWSVRDVLTHISTWEEEAAKMAALTLAGQPVPGYRPYGGINNFNAREQERKRGLPLEKVCKELGTTHARLLEQLERVPEREFMENERLIRRLRFDTYSHYRGHAAAIRNWRSGC